MGVLEGSCIVVEGACASISQLTDHLEDNDFFNITLALASLGPLIARAVPLGEVETHRPTRRR
jgi:hypothetical protein